MPPERKRQGNGSEFAVYPALLSLLFQEHWNPAGALSGFSGIMAYRSLSPVSSYSPYQALPARQRRKPGHRVFQCAERRHGISYNNSVSLFHILSPLLRVQEYLVFVGTYPNIHHIQYSLLLSYLFLLFLNVHFSPMFQFLCQIEFSVYEI